MIPNDHALLLFRFSEQRWMDKFVKGELSFSCAGNFINQAKNTQNDIQGDILEGVFARLLKSDKKILEMRSLLQKDLEEIEDSDYVMLRRRSSKFKPIFCFYGYTANDALIDSQVSHIGRATIRHNFDKRMYSGFSDSSKVKNVISNSHRFTQVTLQPKPFANRINSAMKAGGYGYTMRPINYDFFNKDTFFIEPNKNYDELFCKFPKYKYQYETRICLKDMKLSNILERYTINFGAIPEIDYYMTHEELYIDFDAVIAKQNDEM